MSKIWDEFLVLTNEQSIELFMESPKEEVSHNLYRNLLNLVLPDNVSKAKIAFLYEKDHRTSSWTYSHELGRLYLDNVFPGQVETKVLIILWPARMTWSGWSRLSKMDTMYFLLPVR